MDRSERVEGLWNLQRPQTEPLPQQLFLKHYWKTVSHIKVNKAKEMKAFLAFLFLTLFTNVSQNFFVCLFFPLKFLYLISSGTGLGWKDNVKLSYLHGSQASFRKGLVRHRSTETSPADVMGTFLPVWVLIPCRTLTARASYPFNRNQAVTCKVITETRKGEDWDHFCLQIWLDESCSNPKPGLYTFKKSFT